MRGALAILLVLLLAGCSANAPPPGPSPVPSPTPSPSPTLPAPEARVLQQPLNATPGHTLDFAVRLENPGREARSLGAAIQGADVSGRGSAVAAVPAGGSETVFAPVDVDPGAAPGERSLDLVLLDGGGHVVLRQAGAVRLVVLPPSSGFAPGDSARVVYTGRLADTGQVFDTNDPALEGQSFVHTGSFVANPGAAPLAVATVPRPNVVDGFYEGMLGMVPGESRTVTFGPEKGYGNATVETREPRTVTLPRNETMPVPTASLTPMDFDSYVQATGQGNGTDYKVGDVVNNTRNDETLHYRITAITDQAVNLTLDVHVGERYALHSFWPNASVVTSVEGGNVTFRTDPPVEVGQRFTYYSYWPNMSVLTSLDDANLTITHSPPVGLQFQRAPNSFSAPESATVKALTDTDVVEATASENPLAGQALTFDVRLVGLTKGS